MNVNIKYFLNLDKSDFPKYYFKFLSFGPYYEDTLERLLNHQIYTPVLRQLNDPFEGRWHGNNIDAEFPGEDKEFKAKLDRRRVYCLCSNDSAAFPFSKESILMWSHYADSHKGFCIMFSQEILELSKQANVVARMVEYDDSMAEKTGKIDRDLAIMCKKSKIWESEHEMRLCFENIASCEGNNPYHDIPKDCIIAIFAGSRISPLHDCLLSGVSKKLKCEFHRLKLNNESFRFDEKTNDCS